MDEDEDAFLYGDGDEDTNTGNGVTDIAVTEIAKQQTSADQNGQKTDDAEDDEEEDDDDDEEEEEDSDSDLEIIVDSSAVGAQPPPGYNARPLAPYNKSYQAQKAAGSAAAAAAAISTEYTPLTRPGQSSTAVESLGSVASTSEAKPLTSHVELTPAQAQALQQQQEAQSQLPEGPPPPAPITAPRIDLDPSGQALMLPPDAAGGEPGPLIYHLDPSEMEEKPWRRPGADLSDWFNYGLNEESWRAWGEKKTSIRQERIEMEKDGNYSNRDRGDAPNEQQYQDNSMMQQQQQMQQYGVPPQQAQMMQAMMAASNMNMPMDQMMAFMGMQPGGGGFGMGQSNPMMGMMGMNNPMGMMGFPYGGGMMQNNQNMQQNHDYQGGEGSNGYQDTNGNDEAEYEPTDDLGTSSNDYTANAAEPSASANGGVNGPGQLLPNKPLPVGEIPTGPSSERANEKNDKSKSPLPHHVPTGPKNAGRRYNDRDTGTGAADALDYGAGGGLRDDGEERRSSVGPRSPIRTRDSSAGWDNDIPTGPRNDRDRDHGRRKTSKRGDDDTPRSSRHDDDHDSEATNEGRHRTHSSRSAREKSRSDRRRGDTHGDDREEEESSRSRSSKSRSYARSDRRAGRDTPEEDSHTSSKRSRKRTTTDDGDLLSPPREPRRRRG